MEVTNTFSSEKKNNIYFFLPVVFLLIFVAFFLPTFEGLFSRWTKWDEGLSHGLLVNAVFIYFLYKSLPWYAARERKITLFISHAGLAILSVAWFIFRLSNIYILEQFLLLVLLAVFYMCSYGTKVVFQRRLLLLMPIFTIPIWEQLNDDLVNLSGFAVGKMVQMINMPAVIEGNSIFIPYGHIVIADGCSGLRYFEIALALAYIIGLLNNYKEKQLVPTLVIAALLGLFANWIRIFILVVIGYQTKMQSSLMSDHEYFGWALFGLLCLPAIYFAPVVKTFANKNEDQNDQIKPRIIAPLLILAIGPILGFFINSIPVQKPFERTLATSAQFITSGQLPVVVTAPENSYKEKGLFNSNGTELYAQIDQYQRVNQNDKLVPYTSRLYNNEEWLADNKIVSLNKHSVTLTRFQQKTSGKEVLQLQWFSVGDHKTHSLALAKLLQIPALVTGVNNFKIFTIQAICENANCNQAQTALINKVSVIFADPQNY